MKPILSIVVPCYKQAEFLSETLDSILKQTFRDWECIVVNDGSPDNTSEVADRYVKLDPRFRLIETENGGVSAARNIGIRASSGEFILPLDGDDIILPRYTQLAIERFRKIRKPSWYTVRPDSSVKRKVFGICPNMNGTNSYSTIPSSIHAFSEEVTLTRPQDTTKR